MARPTACSPPGTEARSKYGALKAYLPMSARFASPKGVFYRLSVRGFASDREARNLCMSLRRQGGSCFVRNVAGDAPVQYRVALSAALPTTSSRQAIRTATPIST